MTVKDKVRLVRAAVFALVGVSTLSFVLAQPPQMTQEQIERERQLRLLADCRNVIFTTDQITVPTGYGGKICVRTFGDSLACMTYEEFIKALIPAAPSRVKAEDPIRIPIDAFSEALVVVQVPSTMFPEAIEVPVGTVHEFKTQAEENRRGKRKGFTFNSFTR